MIVSNFAIFTLFGASVTYNIVCVIILELLDVGVDQGLSIAAFDTEFLVACKTSGRKEDKFH
jgi:hypothetical protein